MPENTRERDLVLTNGEFANILDETKGHVSVYVGPVKSSLSQTDRPVVFDQRTRRFKDCNLETSKNGFPYAPKGSYIVLTNPVNSGAENTFPIQGSNTLPKLDYGKKINIEGPIMFALWPGQVANVIDGHRLHSNQYLIVRVYDEDAAKENWEKATLKTVEGGEVTKISTDDLTMGKLVVIKGTEVSFYIPPTGIEVVEDKDGKFVRNAVTLELLEYCILLDENGNKRYVHGPAVVFPKPTERFIEKNNQRKFRAIELNELMGIYVKVIADYKDKDKKYLTGDELFITGGEQKIYYPRPEHAIVKYGDQMLNYAIAIPRGEARYVLNRETGEVLLKKGPCMFLPDPRKEVIVRRVLSERDVELWFPGNNKAKDYNKLLKGMIEDPNSDFIQELSLIKKRSSKNPISTSFSRFSPIESQDRYAALNVGEEIKRSTNFTPPRTVTLDTKYEGAVTINVWPGYAVQVVKKTGERKVIVGPEVHLLEYDETLELLSLSTGKPKNTDNLFKTTYLRVKHNTVTDIIKAETKDFCPVKVKLKYRVNFTDNPNKWFIIENYVKFLSDHMRSILRNVISKITVEDFYSNSIDIVRNAVVGEKDKDSGERPGRLFEENGMNIYDVEVLSTEVVDSDIAEILSSSTQDAVVKRLHVIQKERDLDTIKKIELIERSIEKEKAITDHEKNELNLKRIADILTANLAEIEATRKKQLEKDAMNLEIIENESLIKDKKLKDDERETEQKIKFDKEKLLLKLKEIEAETVAIKEKAEAISPHLIATLQQFSDKKLLGDLAENFNVLSILGGGDKSIIQIAQGILGDTALGDIVKNMQLHLHTDKDKLLPEIRKKK